MDNYQDRIERSRKEQAERQKAVDRDAIPYNPKHMEGRIPMGCSVVVGILISAAIVWAIWFLVKLARGGS